MRVLAMIVVLLAGCAPAVKDLKTTLAGQDSGRVWFSPDGRAVISGDLAFPSAAGPVPVVVLAHGCGGVGNAETGWVPVLRDAGYATFVVDSLGGRGLQEICTQLRLTVVDRIQDVFGALRIVATHPRVDRSRIALMGFSHGGIVALRGATVWARDRFGTASGPHYRAFLPFYPLCDLRTPEMLHLSAPVRIHSGELDDWTPAAPCKRLVADLRAKGQDAEITTYPGAYHAFDSVGSPGQVRLANVRNPADCSFDLPSMDVPIPAGDLERCVRKGATIGWSPQATEVARKNALVQLRELLR